MPVSISPTPASCICCTTGSPCDCLCCTGGYWTEYTFTVSGITNRVCGDCTAWNGTWTLKYRGGCLWTTDDVATDPYCAALPGGDPMWSLACDSATGLWTLSSTIGMGLVLLSSAYPGTNYCFYGGFLSGGAAPHACFPLRTGLEVELLPGGTFVDCDPLDGITWTGSY